MKLSPVRKIFRTNEVETTALNDINIDIAKGNFVSIMGPSGCGKSTLLNIIGLLDNFDGGEYHFLDHEMSKYEERQMRNSARRTTASSFLIDELSVFENVELPLLYQKVSVRERKARAEKVLENMGIITRRDHMPQQLSYGQQQRVA